MPATHSGLRVYNDDGDSLMEPAKGAPRITIVRAGIPAPSPRSGRSASSGASTCWMTWWTAAIAP